MREQTKTYVVFDQRDFEHTKKQLKKIKLNQKILAERLGLSRTYLNLLLTGRRPMNMATFEAIKVIINDNYLYRYN